MADSEEKFSIGKMAKDFELTPRSIRFYEEQGLINPLREGMARVYTHKDRVRLKLILRGKRLGFSLAEIRNLFDLYDTNPNSAEQLKTMLHLTMTKRTALQQQLDDINMLMTELDDVEARCKEELNELSNNERGTK